MYQNDENLFAINPYHLPALREVEAKMSRRAVKLGVPAPAFEVVAEKTVKCSREAWGKLVEWDETRLIVRVSGEAPRLAGWTFVAKVEYFYEEKLVLCAPGETCPTEFRTRGMDCDHCHTARDRKSVIVLRHADGHHVQVGRQCVCDFLGGITPEAALWRLDAGLSLASELRYCESETGRYASRPESCALEFVTAASIIIRRFGWLSRTATQGAEQCTADLVWELLHPVLKTDVDRREYARWIEQMDLHVQERDRDQAHETLEWAASLPTTANDFLYNLGVAARAGVVTSKTRGIMAAAIPAYLRHVERESELHKTAKTRGHVGVVNQRLDFENLTVLSMKYIDGAYGTTTLVIFEDATGNLIKWFASVALDSLDVGNVVNLKATIKQHGEYNGTPETLITRAKITKRIA